MPLERAAVAVQTPCMTTSLSRNPVAWWENLGRPLTRLPRVAAAALLALLAALMVWSALAVAEPARPEVQTETQAPSEAGNDASTDAGDLALYARISGRVTGGESYYVAAMEEQRASGYPTRPFFTVRLPTLAWLHAAIGVGGVRLICAALLLASIAALHIRLAHTVSVVERIGALFMLTLGGAAAVAAPASGLMHEVLAGMLLTLAFTLYTPRRWWPSLLFAALALAVRELAVPFILLWLALAAAGRRWGEVAALLGLLLVFAVGMFAHLQAVEAQRLASDLPSQGWDAMAGLALPLNAISTLTALLLLPLAVAAPLALLPLVGWAALGGRIGLFAVLWFAGYFAAMALFARPDNFYWIQLILPAYMAGLAFAPRAIIELTRNAFALGERQP